MNDVAAKLLNRLSKAGDFLSGEELCREFCITRSAVWKHIELLRAEGYHVDAVTGRGYRLMSLTGRPVDAEVSPFLTTRRFGRKILYHGVTASTNIVAKSLASDGLPEGCVVAADSQTGGRGRMGRTWVSPSGVNLYFSLILRPELPSIRVPQLTLPVINHARNVLFFTAGNEKGKLAERIFLEKEKSVPASLVDPLNGKTFWFTHSTINRCS